MSDLVPNLGINEVGLLEYTIDGQIATLGSATKEKLAEKVTLVIDGREVTVPRVVIARDADRKPILDENGETTYRYTTIYDAATAAYVQKEGDQNPIPILCHREHMNPAAVCRVCLVEVRERGSERSGNLFPACHKIVDDKTEVLTAARSPKVSTIVRMVTELLMSDQPDPTMHSAIDTADHPADDVTGELPRLAKLFGVPEKPRFENSARKKPKDTSSLVIEVDHSACVLCDRCIRACTDVKHNNIIGRTGRGYLTQIAFDLNTPMGDSDCVTCGECAISCPTDALKLVTAAEQELDGDPVPWQELLSHPLFVGISPKFLQYNANAIKRRRYRKGEVLCREGEFGATAFLIEKGEIAISINSRRGHIDNQPRGWFNVLQSFASKLVRREEKQRVEESEKQYVATDAGSVALEPGQQKVATLTPADLIFGEMTCMSNYPRSATATAATEDVQVLVIRRNILYTLQRNTASRMALEKVYRQRAIDSHLRSVELFAELRKDRKRFDELVEFLRPRVTLLRVEPGQTIFRQGDVADHFDMVRVGFVRVAQKGTTGGEVVLNYVGPGGYFGELALLTRMSEFMDSAGRTLPANMHVGRRSATCSAMDHVELVRVNFDDFREIYRRYPEIQSQLDKQGRKYIELADKVRWDVDSQTLADFMDQGLANASSLLVLDLESCTRCDECTKACADSHDGVTRLIRDGLRYDKFLVASSCRSCQDPYCMVGCPVDAIHRKQSKEMIIEDWCIGCGLCANNCPYGNINMHPVETGEKVKDDETGRWKPVLQYKATLCDLCQNTPSKSPSCVYACPHDAAHRYTGQELLALVRESRQASPA